MAFRSLALLLLSYAAGLSAVVIDLRVLGRPLLAEGPPEYGPLYLVRMVLMAAASGFFCAAIWTWSGASPPEERQPVVTRATVWIVLALALVPVLLLVRDPGLFNDLVEEDHPAELLSAALCLGAFAVFLRVATIVRPAAYRLVAAAAALFFFVSGMEELSWFERLLAIETPPLFETNEQHELNLHNFATNEAENVYYFAMFLLLIVAPFVRDETPLLSRRPLVSFFVPGRRVLYTGALAFAFNYDMWNVLATQLAFFVPLFILLSDLLRRRTAIGKPTLACLAGSYVLAQAVFLAYGARCVREWDVTEYKELLLAFSCMVYALEILGRARTSRASPVE